MNDRVVTYVDKYVVNRRYFTPLILTIVVVVLAACSLINREATLGSQVLLDGEAILNCSEECAARGQCGTTAEGSVVLGSAGGPAVDFHELVFPVASRVTINGTDTRMLQPLVGGDPFPLNFYHVTTEELKTGWIAGWCIAAP